MKTIFSSEKKRIINQLKEQYGISKLPYLLLQFGKEKIRLYSGSLSYEELKTLDKNLKIETIGLYAINNRNEDLRLTIDGVQILKNQITKNILEIDDKQTQEWLEGNDLIIKSENSFKIIKNKNDFLGSGKSTGEKITNFIPKERRIKTKRL
jgi:NOL1/NOP2/fmu family ribosome biogenesis protein